MFLIEIEKSHRGAHHAQYIGTHVFPSEGYAVLPESVGTPSTLPNYPFGDITVETIDGVPTVTSWTPLPMPDPEPAPEPAPTLEQRLDALEGAIERGLSL